MPDDANRPRIDPDINANALPIRWAIPRPPSHGANEVLVKYNAAAATGVLVDGVFISPGEVAWVRASSVGGVPGLAPYVPPPVPADTPQASTSGSRRKTSTFKNLEDFEKFAKGR